MLISLILCVVLLSNCCFVCFGDSVPEFSVRNAREIYRDIGHLDPQMQKIHYLKILKEENLLPVEAFLAHSGVATIDLEKRNLDLAKQHSQTAIEIGKRYEDDMPGLLRALYLQDMRNMYEIAEIQDATEEAKNAYQEMERLFEKRADWKEKHTAEYLAVLNARLFSAESEKERDYYIDKIIAEVPSAQTIPSMLFQRYERRICEEWDKISPKIRMMLPQYNEYPSGIWLYELLAMGHRMRGEYNDAVQMYEKGIACAERTLLNLSNLNLSESDQHYYTSSKNYTTERRWMRIRCAKCYIELGKWDEARHHIENAINKGEGKDDGGYALSLLDFLTNNPPGTKLSE